MMSSAAATGCLFRKSCNHLYPSDRPGILKYDATLKIRNRQSDKRTLRDPLGRSRGFAAALRAFGSGKPTGDNRSFNSRGFYIFTRLQCDQSMRSLETLYSRFGPEVTVPSTEQAHRSNACRAENNRSLTPLHSSPQPVHIWEQFCTWPFFFFRAQQTFGVPFLPRAHTISTVRHNQSCSTLLFTDPTALRTAFCQQWIKQAEKRLPRTAGAHQSAAERSAAGTALWAPRGAAPPPRADRSCVTAVPSGGALQSGRSPARGCPSAPRGLQKGRFFPRASRNERSFSSQNSALLAQPFLEGSPGGLRSAPLPPPRPVRARGRRQRLRKRWA